jgi:hypothetical protein
MPTARAVGVRVTVAAERLMAGRGAGNSALTKRASVALFPTGKVWASPGGVFSDCGDLGLAAERPWGWGPGVWPPERLGTYHAQSTDWRSPATVPILFSPPDAPRICPPLTIRYRRASMTPTA